MGGKKCVGNSALDCKSFRYLREVFYVFLSRAVCWRNCSPAFAISFEHGEEGQLQTGLPVPVGGRAPAVMQEDGEQIGRFKVRGLMRELGLISKPPGSHAYKKTTVERPDIPNTLNREFNVPEPNKVWCGEITYIWAQGKWHYLVVVMDLYARRIVGWALSGNPDADLVTKAPFGSKIRKITHRGDTRREGIGGDRDG